ncbi:MAG: hypothetical protein AAFV88_21885 [Planctomycetota bacterium]
MSWHYDQTAKIWHCSNFADLQYVDINNFAEYGQPFSPYEAGYDHDHVPDFANIVIQMPQSAVMNGGYGRNITTLDFPIVNHFLNNGVLMGDTAYMPQVVERGADAILAAVGAIPTLPRGRYDLGTLISSGRASNSDRFINTNLYGWGSYGISSGSISAGDAAYIHGTVSFALKRNTAFVVTTTERRVEAEIGAGDDNWDFNSSTINSGVNAMVATLMGPDHYNLTGPIKIQFRGPGKRMIARKPI